MLVILSGVAGAGKDTVKKEIIKKMENVTSIPSFTDRPQRPGDIPGQTYLFISRQQFENMINNNELYEYDMHHNNYYGVGKKVLDNEVKKGNIIIKDIEVNGTENLVKILKDKIKVITIFLKVPKEELRKRLENRIDLPSQDEINLRLSRFDYEESKMNSYNYVINNDNLEKTVNIISTIIENEYKM